MYFRRTFLGAMFCLLLIGGLSAQTTSPKQVSPEEQLDKDDEIKIDTLLIDVPVSVLDSDGKFVAGLRKDNFQIFENGVSQKIEYFASVEQPFTVVLLLDVSGSMHNNLDDIKAAALNFIDKLNPSDRIVGIAFDQHLKVLNKNLRDRQTLRDGIKKLQGGFGTYLYPTVEVVSRKILKRITNRKALILFSDGIDGRGANFFNGQALSTYQTSLTEAESSGALIYCVQYNADERRENVTANAYLNDLAELSGGKLFSANKIQDLSKIFTAAAEELRWQYSIGYSPETPAKPNERREIKVKVNRENIIVRARDGYTGKP